MAAQTVERLELQRVIDGLEQEKVIVTLDFLRTMRDETPNAETQAAMAELRARRGRRASNIGEFFEAMHNASDSNA